MNIIQDPICWKSRGDMTFNLGLNNHIKDTKKANSILFCEHFQQQGHNFNKTCKIHHHRQTGITKTTICKLL